MVGEKVVKDSKLWAGNWFVFDKQNYTKIITQTTQCLRVGHVHQTIATGVCMWLGMAIDLY